MLKEKFEQWQTEMMMGLRPVYVSGFSLEPQASGFALDVEFVDKISLERQKHNFYGGDIDELIIMAEQKRKDIRLALLEALEEPTHLE